MKLIALKGFARTPALKAVKIEGELHSKHIHKGAEFEIGSAKTIEELQDENAPEARIVAQLFVSHCVGDATDKKVVEAVRADLALDKKREENAAKLNSAANNTALVDALTSLITKAATAEPAGKK